MQCSWMWPCWPRVKCPGLIMFLCYFFQLLPTPFITMLRLIEMKGGICILLPQNMVFYSSLLIWIIIQMYYFKFFFSLGSDKVFRFLHFATNHRGFLLFPWKLLVWFRSGNSGQKNSLWDVLMQIPIFLKKFSFIFTIYLLLEES